MDRPLRVAIVGAGPAGVYVADVLHKSGTPASVDMFEKLPAPSEAEIDMLDMALAVEPNSRLSCQVICSDATDGIKVTVAPE